MKNKKNKISVSFRMNADTLRIVDGIAQDNETDRTAVLEYAIHRLLAAMLKTNKRKAKAESKTK